MNKHICYCGFCKEYRRYKWATVMECLCGCHKEFGISGHSSLCCEFPNALQKNNPYKKLKTAQTYKKKMVDYLGVDVDL